VDRTLPFSSSKPALDLLPRRHSSVWSFQTNKIINS
jgi:hypothetical protein